MPPFEIAGCKAGCSCMLPKDLPLVLLPGEQHDFVVSIRVPKQQRANLPETMDFPLTLFTSIPTQAQVASEFGVKFANDWSPPASRP